MSRLLLFKLGVTMFCCAATSYFSTAWTKDSFAGGDGNLPSGWQLLSGEIALSGEERVIKFEKEQTRIVLPVPSSAPEHDSIRLSFRAMNATEGGNNVTVGLIDETGRGIAFLYDLNP